MGLRRPLWWQREQRWTELLRRGVGRWGFASKWGALEGRCGMFPVAAITGYLNLGGLEQQEFYSHSSKA